MIQKIRRKNIHNTYVPLDLDLTFSSYEMTSQVQENDLEQFCESFSKKNSIIWENDQKQNSISANEKQMKFAFPAYE